MKNPGPCHSMCFTYTYVYKQLAASAFGQSRHFDVPEGMLGAMCNRWHSKLVHLPGAPILHTIIHDELPTHTST